MPGVCSEVVSPELPEERVVFILWPAGLVVVGIVASEHVQVGVICHATMAASCWGRSMAYGKEKAKEIQEVSLLEGQEYTWCGGFPTKDVCGQEETGL